MKVMTKNGEMEYLHFGNESGEKFVILPGVALKSVMGAAEAIKAAYATMTKDYDIYLFDHISVEPKGYSISDMAVDTLTAFEELGLDHVHLMGVSMGGMVSQTIALKAPERISALILCSTAMNTVHSNKLAFEKMEDSCGGKKHIWTDGGFRRICLYAFFLREI